MEEIQIGEYVRTNLGEIAKIVNTNMFDKTIYKDEQGAKYYLENIVKHSRNIINLIEVGDYVNGSKVVDIAEDIQTGEVHLEMTYNYTNEEKGDCTIYNKDIKTILTKEQFESMQYTVRRLQNYDS